MNDGIRENKLDLGGEALTSPTRMHVAILEAVMLWPHDKAARMKAIHASTVAFLRGNPNFLASAPDGVDLFGLAADAEPLTNVSEASKEPFIHGIICGAVMAEVCGLVKLGDPNASVGKCIEIAEKTFWPKWRVKTQTINNTIWPRYKCVSHLWAAFWLKFKTAGPNPFPCRINGITEFLAESKAIQVMAENTRTRKAPVALLPRGIAIELPSELPIVEIEFERVRAR